MRTDRLMHAHLPSALHSSVKTTIRIRMTNTTSFTKVYTNKGSGHGLRWQWSFVYEATECHGRDLSWQWSLFRLDLSLMGFGLGLVLDLMKHWPRSHVSWPPELNKFSCDTLNENKHVSGSNKKDGYRQLNVRQLDSLRPWDHRGKFYMDRKRGLVKRLAACNHLSSTISEI